MQALVSEISQMDRQRRVWEIAHMAKNDAPPGISAKLDHLLEVARPKDISERQFCIQSKVSTSFFTDLRNGREPGIDKVERLANRAGLRLSELVQSADAIQPGRLALPIALPSAERMQTMMLALLDLVDLERPRDELAGELALQLPIVLEQAGAVLASPDAASKTTRGGRPRQGAKRDPGQP